MLQRGVRPALPRLVRTRKLASSVFKCVLVLYSVFKDVESRVFFFFPAPGTAAFWYYVVCLRAFWYYILVRSVFQGVLVVESVFKDVLVLYLYSVFSCRTPPAAARSTTRAPARGTYAQAGQGASHRAMQSAAMTVLVQARNAQRSYSFLLVPVPGMSQPGCAPSLALRGAGSKSSEDAGALAGHVLLDE